MAEVAKPARWAILVNVCLALIIAASGVYVLIEKKFIISGKLTGHLHQFSKMESIIVGSSFFLVAAFLVLFLSPNKKVKLAGEWLLGIAIVLFLFSSFVNI